MLKRLNNRPLFSYLLLNFLFVISFSACAPAVYRGETLGSARFLRTTDNSSIVHLEVQGVGNLKNRRKFDACANALRTLLLQGISGSVVCEYPLASQETKILAERELEKLMNSGNYARFINYAVETKVTGRIPDPITKGYTSRRQKTYAVGVNYVDLRKYFESIGSIRKFGL